MQLDLGDLDDFAQGCAILGTGGGGDVDAALLQLRVAVERHGPVRVVDLDELPDETLILPLAGWGAPTVGIEKLGSGREGEVLRDAAERWFGEPVGAVMAGEIGGGNGVQPAAWASQMGLPLADADGMGRAFPEGPQVAMTLAGLSPAPVFLTDEHGNLVTFAPADEDWYERLARAITVAFGGQAAGADFVMPARVARGSTVRGSVSRALALGRARREGEAEAVIEIASGASLIAGTVVDVRRRTTGGFAVGEITVAGTDRDAGRTVTVHVQNENLLALEGERAVAMVPDLIVALDEATGLAIPTERVRYGQRVRLIGIPCDPVWRTPAGLALAGPSHFGFAHTYRPLAELARG